MELLKSTNIGSCKCGSEHNIDVKTVIIQNNLIDILDTIIPSIYFDTPILAICDKNTYRVAARSIYESLGNKARKIDICKIQGNEVDGNLIPDEKAIASVIYAIKPGTKLLIAIGSGVINDITRFIAFKLNIDFISMPTAPSMDGIASSVAALIVNGLKITYPAKPALSIIGDLDILEKAPMRMKAAGFADLLGKKTCTADWKLSNVLNNEPICKYTINLVQKALNDTIHQFKESKTYDFSMLSGLTKGLILSGLAISMVGTSRPASGSEHHISHFLELKSLIDSDVKHNLHGETVAIGTFLSSSLYSEVFSTSFDEFKKIIEEHSDYQLSEERHKRLLRAYGPLSSDMILNWENSKISEEEKAERLDNLSKNWEILQKNKEFYIGSIEEVKNLMEESHIKYLPKDYGYDKQIIEDALICAKEIRVRYTILTMLDELDVLEYYAKKIMNNIYGE